MSDSRSSARTACMVLVAVLLAGASVHAAETELELDSTAQHARSLTSVRLFCTSDSTDSTIACVIRFDRDSTPYYTSGLNEDSTVTYTFYGTRNAWSDSIVSMGPIRKITAQTRRINLNAQVKGLRPDWHLMTVLTFDCRPVPKVRELLSEGLGAELTVWFPWPAQRAKRAQYYLLDGKRRKHPGIGVAVGVGAAALLGAGGYFLWQYLDKSPDEEPLPVALPRHPEPGATGSAERF